MIQLTKDDKVTFLEAVKSGEIDANYLQNLCGTRAADNDETLSPEQIESELIRLETFDGNLADFAALMMRYAKNEISRDEYLFARLALKGITAPATTAPPAVNDAHTAPETSPAHTTAPGNHADTSTSTPGTPDTSTRMFNITL